MSTTGSARSEPLISAPHTPRHDAACEADNAHRTELGTRGVHQPKLSHQQSDTARFSAFFRCIQTAGWQTSVNQFVKAGGWIATSHLGISRPQSKNMPHPAAHKLPQFTDWRITTSRISKNGDIVLQTGIFKIETNIDGTTDNAQQGNFLLVWQRPSATQNEPIRIAFGLLTQKGTVLAPTPQIESANATSAQAIGGRKGDALTLAEIQFAGICGASGMFTAFDLFAANDIALLRSSDITTGKATILSNPRIKTERWRYIVQSSAIDTANEMAYAFGRYTMTIGDGKTEHGYFARVWQAMPDKDSNDFANWRVIIDAASPQSRT